MNRASSLLSLAREWVARVGGAIGAGPRDRDLDEELRLHVELSEEAARRRGDSAGAARAARIRVGGRAQAAEALRDQRGIPWLADVSRDVRHSLRSLRRAPGFATVSILMLALGIGANTADDDAAGNGGDGSSLVACIARQPDRSGRCVEDGIGCRV